MIELLIVVAIIGILAAIAIPSYVGMQERARKGSILRVASSNLPVLQAWINSVKKGGTNFGNIIEIDSDGNGLVAPPDLDNTLLSTQGVITTFVASKPDMSPWSGATPLWINGGVAVNQTACDATAATKPGQITLCFNPAENQSIRSVFISAADRNSSVIYSKAITAD